MDKNQKVELLQSKLSELCERIDKDYVRVSKLNGSKEDIIKEVDKLLFSYQNECENNWRDLEKYYEENKLGSYFDINKARQWFVSHENKFINLKEKLNKLLGRKNEIEKDWSRLDGKQFPKQNNICWECHKNKSDKWYINQETNLEFCSQACNLEHNAELCENCVQKCLKYENGVAVDYQTYYRDNEKKIGTLCFTCKQKQREELKNELERLEKEQSEDKEEMERLKKLMEGGDNSSKNNNTTHIQRERERAKRTS